jgi:hypothetical protein
VKASDLEPYYRQYFRNGVLRSDVNAFYTKTRYKPSKVWVLDLIDTSNYDPSSVEVLGKFEQNLSPKPLIPAAEPATNNGPFSEAEDLNAFLISSVPKTVGGISTGSTR